jgi:hypothetical protein
VAHRPLTLTDYLRHVSVAPAPPVPPPYLIDGGSPAVTGPILDGGSPAATGPTIIDGGTP